MNQVPPGQPPITGELPPEMPELPGLPPEMPPEPQPNRTFRCDRCHTTNAQVAQRPENIGLDNFGLPGDPGVGGGRFKVPSLRNIADSFPYMHDGRFATLDEVLEHYSTGVQDVDGLSPLLRNDDGSPQRLNMSADEKAALMAFLLTLSDTSIASDPRFGNPFDRPFPDSAAALVRRQEAEPPPAGVNN